MTDILFTNSAVSTGTVVVPAYNEAEVIGASLLEIARMLVEHSDLASLRWDILVVDDGSVDNTGAAAEECRETLTRLGVGLRILTQWPNRGLGKAMQTAFEASTGDVVVVVDCDLSYSPSHIPRLVRALVDNKAHVALASPYMPGGRTVCVPRGLERRSRMANSFLSTIGRVNIATMTGMVRAYQGPYIRSLSLKSMDAEINIEVIYKTQVLRGHIVEVPSTLDWSGLADRLVRTRSRSRRSRLLVCQTLVGGFLFRPYLIFLAAGLVSVGLGVLSGAAAMALQPLRSSLLIWSAGAMSTGVLLCFGFLLSLQMKRCYDELFFQGYRAEFAQRRSIPEHEMGPANDAAVLGLADRGSEHHA